MLEKFAFTGMIEKISRETELQVEELCNDFETRTEPRFDETGENIGNPTMSKDEAQAAANVVDQVFDLVEATLQGAKDCGGKQGSVEVEISSGSQGMFVTQVRVVVSP